MFVERTDVLPGNPAFRGYGATVTLTPEGPAAFVAGYGCANRYIVRRDDRLVDTACGVVADAGRHGIGVAAADLDADGREELYVHNADTFGGRGRESDLLLDATADGYVDLFASDVNDGRANVRAGRSVAAVDRLGTGRYGLFVTGYGTPTRFYELGDDGSLTDLAEAVGAGFVTGARSLAVGPLVTDRMDVYVGNERGANYLLRNDGGQFTDVAAEYGVADAGGDARGVTLVDPRGNGRFDIVCGNWEGRNRLFERRRGGYEDVAPAPYADPTRVRSVVSADFDNDGRPELFVNAIGAANRLLRYERSPDGEDGWTAADPGAALESGGLGTGAAVADFDADGTLELLVVHGEVSAQPLSLFAVPNDDGWLRVTPRTVHGAPARGAVVHLETDAGRQTRVVDAGSGYLCQMEPVAHFGLGDATPECATVRWPDGRERTVSGLDPRSAVEVPHPSE